MSAPPVQPLSEAPSNAANLRVVSRWSDRTLICLLILCAALPYANTLPNDFVYDDTAQVLDNPYVGSSRYLRQIFTTTDGSAMYTSCSYYLTGFADYAR